MNVHRILKYPLSTEKAVRLMQSENKIIFAVDNAATKVDIRMAVEEEFKVKVRKINTMIDKNGIKRAYIQLTPDYPAIDVTTKLGLM